MNIGDKTVRVRIEEDPTFDGWTAGCQLLKHFNQISVLDRLKTIIIKSQ